MTGNTRDGLAFAPALAAVRRTEHIDSAAFERNNHRAVGLYHRLAAQSGCMIRRREPRAPCRSAVAGNAHENIARAERLIPFGVAVAVEGAGGCVVAHAPVLIVQAGAVDHDGISPRQPIGTETDCDIADLARTRTQPNQRKSRNHPHGMLRVVCYGRIGGGAKSPALVVHRESREIAILPCFAAVGGSRKSYVAASPANRPRPPRHVKCTDNRISPRKRIGLDFGFVIAIGVREIVSADSDSGSLPERG